MHRRPNSRDSVTAASQLPHRYAGVASIDRFENDSSYKYADTMLTCSGRTVEYKVLPDGKLLVTVKRQMSYLNLTRDDLELGVRGRFMRFLEQHRLMRRPDKADVAPSVWAARLREAGVDDDDDDDDVDATAP